MPREEKLQALRHQGPQQALRLRVSQVSKGTTDPALEHRGIRAFRQQLRFVVKLQKQSIAALISLHHVSADMPQVREHPKLLIPGAKAAVLAPEHHGAR